MSRFAKLYMMRFVTLKLMGTLMAELMILEGRLELQVPPQYLHSTEQLQPQLVDKLQNRSAQMFLGNNVEVCLDQFQDRSVTMFQSNNAEVFQNSPA